MILQMHPTYNTKENPIGIETGLMDADDWFLDILQY